MRIVQADSLLLPTMIAYGATFWEQTQYYLDYGIPYDADTVALVATECMENGVALAALEDDQVVGLMLCLVVPFPMNNNYTQAVEWVFYVDKRCREMGLGADLMERAESELKDKGVTLLTMVALANVTPESALELYRKRGYYPSEISMTKDIT